MTSDSLSGPLVDVEWLFENLTKVTLVDVRPQQAYLRGHVPGAVSSQIARVPMASSRSQVVNTWAEGVLAALETAGAERNKPIVFYEDYSGTEAARAVWAADTLGFTRAAMLDGGVMAWSAAGFPLDSTIERVERTRLEWHEPGQQLIGADEINESLGQQSPLISVIDTRSDTEWAAGTIPGAVHYEWTRALDSEGRFRSMDVIARDLEAEGIDLKSGQPVATFCGSGYRAAHIYIVLKALGIEDARNYAPSWGEWASRPDVPVVRPAHQ